MRIYFYHECNFNINKASVYDCGSLAEWFDSQHKNPDDYEIVGKDGEYHDAAYEAEVCAVYPRIMGGKKKGKNILTAVIGLALILTGGGALAHALHMSGTMAKALGAGLLLSGGGSLLMGKMKMPSMDVGSESATKQSYQWNVGNLSTSRGVKGVTFGSNVIPEGELLAYKTYGTNSLEKVIDQEAGWYNKYGGAYRGKDRPMYFDRGWKYEKNVEKRSEISHKEITDSSSFLEVLIGAGEGELDSITDIKINDIALSDLDMVENTDYAIRLGSNTQTALKQTNLDSQIGYSSIGQTVPQKLNDSVTPLLVTTPEACDSCEIAFQTNGWYLYDTSSGAKNKAYIKLKIGYRVSGSSGDYTYLTKTISEIDNNYPTKSESAFYFKIAIKFPSNNSYQICIENDSAELNYTKGLLSAAEYQGSALPDRAALNITCDNIACYDNKEQTYPNTALIWLRIPASQTLNGSMPKITWKQTRANIYAYNGSSYVTKPANNLAWAIYDIIAQVRKDGNTYHNEGEDVNNIDFDKFVAFATFCDSIGATGNWFLNKLDTSWSNAMSVATSCRAFIGLKNGKVCPYWDAPTEMTQIFTVGNYENMSGAITAKKDRAKAIEATFNNEEEKFDSRTVRVEIDNDHSAEAVSMTFVGLSNPVNVSKAAHYILRRNKYLVQSIKFTADIDSIVCELNDVIGIQCDLTEYGVGGRIFKVENGTISLDAPVTLARGNTYALLVRHTDGTLERKTPVEINGTYTQLTFSSAWSKPVLKGDVYSFGIANSEVRKYRVTGITRTNDLKAQIEAIEYNTNVYDELAVAPYTYTNPNAGINNVTTTYTPEAVELAWDSNNSTAYVNVYIDGVFYGRYQKGATIPNINSSQNIKLVPVDVFGNESLTPYTDDISNSIPVPPMPVAPTLAPYSTGCIAIFEPVPLDEYVYGIIIYENGVEKTRTLVSGKTVTVNIPLNGGQHNLVAFYYNSINKLSEGRSFVASPKGVDPADIVADYVIANVFETAQGVGSSVDGVKFSADGMQGWKNHLNVFNLNANGDSVISGWTIGPDKLYSSNIEIGAAGIKGYSNQLGQVFDLNMDGTAKIGGWNIDSHRLYNNNISIDSEGTIQSTDFASDLNGWSIDKYGNAEFNNVKIRGAIKSAVFEKDNISVVGGYQLIRPATVVSSKNETEGSYDVYVENNSEFAINDIVRMRLVTDSTFYDTWATVAAKGVDNDNGDYLTLSLQSGTWFVSEAGQTIVNYGPAGSGGVLLDGNAPKMDMYTHNGSPWNGLTCHVRIGNLNGINGITTNKYGFFAGNSDASNANRHYIQWDGTNLNIQGQVVITGGSTYNAINTAQSTADNALNHSNSYVTCSTAAATVAKVGVCAGFTSAMLVSGARISVKFTNANTAANPTLNVNSTGAKAIYANGAAIVSPYNWNANDTVDFIYNGSQWEMTSVSGTTLANTAVSNAATAQSTANTAVTNAATAQSTANTANSRVVYQFGTCATAAATAAKVVTLANYPGYYAGSRISVKFTYANTVANPTLNVNSKGAKNIFVQGAKLTADSYYNWKAGDIVDFVYDGTQWNITSVSGANQTVIDGGRIKTGTLDAGVINTQTLNAAVVNAPTFVKSGSTAAKGLVPAPSTTAGTTKMLCEDGTWKVPPTAAACSGNAATATTAAACSGNAATATTATNANNAKVTPTTSNAWYPLVFGSSAATAAGNQALRVSKATAAGTIPLAVDPNADATAVNKNVYAYLRIGNGISDADETNYPYARRGLLRLYGRNTSYTDIITAVGTTARTLTLPDKAGTVALTSDIVRNFPADGSSATTVQNLTSTNTVSNTTASVMLVIVFCYSNDVNATLKNGSTTLINNMPIHRRGADGSGRYPGGSATTFLLLKNDVLTLTANADNIHTRVIVA